MKEKPRIIPKGKNNKYGSKTGPYNMIDGWGLPAGLNDKCPKCGSKKFHYVAGFAEAATNECPDCKYEEWFCY
jgi:uncharacterized protein (DUF983 family)